MRLRIVVATAAVALVVAGLSAAAAPRPLVLGVSWEGNGMLARLDARTLAAVGRRLDIGKPPAGLVARSPAGRTIALGHGSIPELRFVDLKSMRAAGRLRLPGLGSVLHGIWAAPDRLIVLRAGEDPEVIVVDPRTRRVRSRLPLEGEVAGAVSAAGKLLVLLAPNRAIGPVRLAVVTTDGAIRTVALPGIAAGFAPALNEETPGRQASPGIAVAPTGKRAAVVSPDTLLGVDLDTLEVRREPLSVRSPARVGKWIEGWGRRALWIGDDTIAVSGWSYSLVGKQPTQSTIGVRLVDVRTGVSHLLDSAAAWAARVGDTLLAFGGPALRGYRFDGTLRFELLAGQDSGYVQTAGRYAYVGSQNSSRFVVVDTRAGRVLRTVSTSHPTIVLGPGIIVRPATLEDADAIGRIQVETWRAAYRGLMPDEAIAQFDVEERQRQWREWLAPEPPPGSANLVAELDGEVVGFVSVGAAQSEEEAGELYAIYLHPSCWDRGIGRSLIERAEESMRSSGFTQAILWVMEGNERAERFYHAAGWKADGRKVDIFQGAEVPELRYRKAL